MLKCKMYYMHHIYNMSCFTYFSALKTAALKKPISILKSSITGSYFIVTRNSRIKKKCYCIALGIDIFLFYIFDLYNVKNRNDT